MGVRKRFIVLPFLAALLAVLAACLPQPDEPVEWVQRPESIVIQVKALHEPASELEQRVVVPEFTLYGDGALIFTRPDAEGHLQLLQAELPSEAIRDLLEFIEDEGFLDFAYEQPRPAGVDNFPTTYLYVNTIAGANAVKAALGTMSFEESDERFAEYSRLQHIRQRLDGLDIEALGGRVLGDYPYDEIVLFVHRIRVNVGLTIPSWPIMDVDLASLAPPLPEIGMGSVRIDQASELTEGRLWGFGFYRQDGRVFQVGYRPPLLPFQENFPEFDR